MVMLTNADAQKGAAERKEVNEQAKNTIISAE